MNERDLFLQANPEIRKMLNNDISLKDICESSVIQSYLRDTDRFPILFDKSDVAFNYNDYSILNYVKFLLCMVLDKQLERKLAYQNCKCYKRDVDDLLNMLNKAFGVAQAKFIEYMSGIVGIELQVQTLCRGDIIVKIDINVRLVEAYRGALSDTFKFLNGCILVKQELIAKRKVWKGMSELELASVLYNWVVLHTRYDLKLSKYSYTGYSALTYGYAVCQGYTALFNALCKLFGLRVVGMSGEAYNRELGKTENHIWTFALLDNRNTYIDVTWGHPNFKNESDLKKYGIDSGLLCDFKFFDIPYNILQKDHKWDKSLYG